VSLCPNTERRLAPLIERTIEQRLGSNWPRKTARSAFEQLATCRLNMISVDPDQPVSYIAT
jgi:hypothetical protein